MIPPGAFWAAAASSADPADLDGLGEAAGKRGLYRDAACLYKAASSHGSLTAAARLVRLFRSLHPSDQRPAAWAATHASLDDPEAVAILLHRLNRAGATSQVTALASRAASHTSLDNPGAVAALLSVLPQLRATSQVTVLARRAAAHVRLDDPGAVATLLHALRAEGATGQATALLDRDPAAHVRLDDPGAVTSLLSQLHLSPALRTAGAQAQATRLIKRLPAAGMFDLFCQQDDRAARFRFGRKADGLPAKPWAWTDLRVNGLDT